MNFKACETGLLEPALSWEASHRRRVATRLCHLASLCYRAMMKSSSCWFSGEGSGQTLCSMLRRHNLIHSSCEVASCSAEEGKLRGLGQMSQGATGSQWRGQDSIQLFPARACASHCWKGHTVTASQVRKAPGTVDCHKDVTEFLYSTNVDRAPSWCWAWCLQR